MALASRRVRQYELDPEELQKQIDATFADITPEQMAALPAEAVESIQSVKNTAMELSAQRAAGINAASAQGRPAARRLPSCACSCCSRRGITRCRRGLRGGVRWVGAGGDTEV